MNISVLKSELDTDPLTRGYSGMSDEDAAADLNTIYREKNKLLLTGNELFTATDETEFSGLSDVKRTLWVSWCNTDRDPFDAANVVFVQYIFGDGSTLANLQNLRKYNVSRGVELGIGWVRPGNVVEARS